MSFDKLSAKLLTIIFENYIRSEGHLEFLKNVIPVCGTWRDIGVSSSSLCKIVDIVGVRNTKQRYLPEQELASVNWDLPVTTELRITYVWLNAKVSAALFSGCPNLKSLSLCDCRVHRTTFILVARYCRKLESIALQKVNESGAYISKSTLEPIFITGGRNLKCVSMSDETFNNELECGDFVVAILDNCPRLEQLKLSTNLYDSHWPRFPERKLRTCCPQLRVLSVERFVVYCDSYTALQTEGYQNLEELELISLSHLGGFLNVLRNAEKLKRLTMRNVRSYSRDNPINIHQDIGVKRLEQLHLVNTAFGAANIQQLLGRWRNSLRELTLEDELYFLSDQALLALIRGNENRPYESFMNQEDKPALEVLKLSVPITNESVLVQVVRECKRLRAIDISKCMNLPESYRWKLDTVEDISSLRDWLCISRVRDDDWIAI